LLKMPALRAVRVASTTLWKGERKSLHGSGGCCAKVRINDFSSNASVAQATENSMHNLDKELSAPQHSICGMSKESSSNKYGNACKGVTDIGSLLRQQLQYEGYGPESNQWKFVEALYMHKESKEYQLMGDILRDICRSNVARYHHDSNSISLSDILQMKSYIHHVQNPRYGLVSEKTGQIFGQTKKCLLELGVEEAYFHG